MEQKNEQFSFLIDAAFQITGRGLVVCGLIESGNVSVGDIVNVPHKGLHTVKGIEMFRKLLDYAEAGDNVGLLFSELKKSDVNPGERITSIEFETERSYENIEPSKTLTQKEDMKIDSLEQTNIEKENVSYDTKLATIDVEESNNDDAEKIDNFEKNECETIGRGSFEQTPTPKATFCFNCGEAINEKFKHCPYCGTNLSELTDSNSKESKDDEEIVETSEVEFSIAGRKICFTQEFIDYNTLRKRFFDKATELETAYIKYYTSREHNFNALFDEEIPEVVYKTIDAVKFGVSVLMEYGIDDIDDEELSKMVSSDESIKEALGYIFEKADDINRFAENLGDYRDIKRAGRSYWEGGGFGVGGAIKGAITAGAFNLGTNIFRGIGDSITNASDKAKISKMKKDLANDKRVFECLHNTVFEYNLKVFDCVEEILIEEEIIPEFEFDFKKAEARANNYIKQYNIQKSEVVYNKTIDIICECINDCPYSVDLYYHLYNLINGNKDDIHDLAKYFGLERDYKFLLIKGDTNWINTVKSWSEDTADEIDKKIAELESVQKDNVYIQINQDIERLKRKKEQLNIQKSSTEKILDYKEAAENAIRFNDMEELWKLAETKNSYAEYILISYYEELCTKKPFGYYSCEEKEKLMSDVRKKANDGNLLAKFIMNYVVYSETNTKEIYDLVKTVDKQNVFASPLYYISYYALKRNISADDSGFSRNDTIRCITKSADMLFPPALKYVGELYKYGKAGVMTSNKELSAKYEKLNAVYNYPVATSLIEDDNFVNHKVLEIKKLRKPVDEAIAKSDYNYIIHEIENGNVYAEYVFEKKNIAKANCIAENSKDEARSKDFANYLSAIAFYKKYNANQENSKEKIQHYADEIMHIAKTGNISAIYQTGQWKMNRENILLAQETGVWKDSHLRVALEGVRLIEIAAKHLYPPALYTLGYNYYKGNYPLAKDEKLAKYYLTLSAAYDWQAAKDILSKMENQQQSSESSGCFITSAVCKSFGKPDNCYELTSFRNFRDDWLTKQADGDSLIKEYYKIAPIIVENIDGMSNSIRIYKNIWENYLKECLRFIEDKKFEQCKKTYCKMVNDLKNIYYTKGSCI